MTMKDTAALFDLRVRETWPRLPLGWNQDFNLTLEGALAPYRKLQRRKTMPGKQKLQHSSNQHLKFQLHQIQTTHYLYTTQLKVEFQLHFTTHSTPLAYFSHLDDLTTPHISPCNFFLKPSFHSSSRAYTPAILVSTRPQFLLVSAASSDCCNVIHFVICCNDASLLCSITDLSIAIEKKMPKLTF